MANIKQIKLPANSSSSEEIYDIVDQGARDLLAAKADLASPALTGTPTAPTADAGTSTTQLATTEFVANAVSGIDMSTKMDKENPVGTGSFRMNMAEGAVYGKNVFIAGSQNTASGDCSHAEGQQTKATGLVSHAEGYSTQATGEKSHAEGQETVAQGQYSHAEGYACAAYDVACHAEGNGCGARGIGAHAEGGGTSVDANGGHAEGAGTVVNGVAGHAEGFNSEAAGVASHAEGMGTIALGDHQHVQGRANIEDSAGTYAHIVGNGTVDEEGNIVTNSNAHTLDWKGNAWYAGKVTVGAAPTEDLDVATKAYVDGLVPSKISNQSGTAISVWTGTAAEYDEVTTKDANTLYFITE